MPYYAVRVGRTPGVYKTWEECKAQVEGVSRACHKKFSTEEEAWNFVNETGEGDLPSSQSQESSASAQASAMQDTTEASLINQMGNLELDEQPSAHQSGSPPSSQPGPSGSGTGSSQPRFQGVPFNESEGVSVYTHGVCFDSGTSLARAGLGVYWGPNHDDNVSERLPGHPTHNRAEIHAAVRAVMRAKEKGISKLIIKTNSMYLINSITEWIIKWKTNGWRAAGNEPVENKEDFEELDAKLEGISVGWVYHKRDKGNEGFKGADKLATDGAKRDLP